MTPAPLMCAHVFVSVITLRTRMTQLRTQSTKEVRRIGCIILFNHLPRRPAEFYIPLSPRRSPKDRDGVHVFESHVGVAGPGLGLGRVGPRREEVAPYVNLY